MTMFKTSGDLKVASKWYLKNFSVKSSASKKGCLNFKNYQC